jgi:CRISPR type III-associated protein (TIGR04423 family)
MEYSQEDYLKTKKKYINMETPGIRTYNNLSDIPTKDCNYIGYYWMSDTQNPEYVDNNFTLPTYTINPFIIEGMLWDKTNKRSIMIKHTGRYVITQVDFKEISSDCKIADKSYMGYKPKGKHLYKQIWLPEPDPLCQGMEVLKLKAIVFTGFKED